MSVQKYNQNKVQVKINGKIKNIAQDARANKSKIAKNFDKRSPKQIN